MKFVGVQIAEILLCFVLVHWETSMSAFVHVPDPGFDEEQRYFIYVENPRLKYTEAEAVCRNKYNGYLVSTHTNEQKTLLKHFLDNYHIDTEFWIGLRENCNGQLVWNDGHCTPELSPQPHRRGVHGPSCYMIDHHDPMGWHEANCDEDKQFICQRDPHEQPVKMMLHIVPSLERDLKSCEEICRKIVDCFLAANASEACIVGLASKKSETSAFTSLGTIVDVGHDGFDEFIDDSSPSEPQDCQPSSPGRSPASKDQVTVDDYLEQQGNLPLCSKPLTSTLVSSVSVTKTLTTTYRETIIVTSCSPSQQFSSASTVSPVILQPTPILTMALSHWATPNLDSVPNTVMSQMFSQTKPDETSEFRYSTHLVTEAAATSFTIGDSSLVSGVMSSKAINLPDISTETEPSSLTEIKYITRVVTDRAAPFMMTATVMTIVPATAPSTVTVTATTTINYRVSSGFNFPVSSLMAPGVLNVSESTAKIVRELTVEKKSLSKAVRARTSAQNKETSAVVLGTLVSFISISLFGVILLMDIQKLLMALKLLLFHNLRQAMRN